jgi:hypothetical protein
VFRSVGRGLCRDDSSRLHSLYISIKEVVSVIWIEGVCGYLLGLFFTGRGREHPNPLPAMKSNAVIPFSGGALWRFSDT